ncbi:MAG: TonB-dependent receptor [Polyangiaceae bacterium]|nr:TonB-dependent receptor [Polyangiaceae bacterium]
MASAQGAVEPPVVRSMVEAEWPAGRAPAGAEVLVPVIVVVATDGRVSEAAVEVAGDPALDQAVRRAVERWGFEPARRGGMAVPAKVRVLVRFAAGTPAGGAVSPPLGARAQPDNSRAAAEPAPVEVSVRGARAPELGAASASAMRIRVGQLADVPRRSAEQLLTLAPGVLLTNHGGEGHASAVFLRGFDAKEGQDVEFLLEGVPLNEVSNAHGHGYADTHFIIPELVQSLDVVEGPFDPRQGDFAVAGSANYHLGLPRRGVMARAGYGSFGTKRLLLLWGPGGAGAGTFAGVDLLGGDGFGPNRAHASARLMAQHEFAVDARTTVTLLATSYAARFDSAGVVRRDDFEARRLPCASDRDSQFFCLYDPNQGGSSARHALSVRLVRAEEGARHEHTLFASTRPLRMRENFTGYVTDVGASDGLQRGDGLEQAHEAATFGARGRYAASVRWRGEAQQVEVGYAARHDDGVARQRRLRTADGAPYRVDFDNRLRITSLGAYAGGRLAPFGWLALRAGLRVDAYAFAVVDRNRPALDRSGERERSQAAEAFGVAWQPRASAEVTVAPGLRWLTGAGVGSRSSDAKGLSDGEFAPFARVRALETGAVYERRGRFSVEARALGFYTRVDRDLVFDPVGGRNATVGASNRFGALATARLTARPGFDAQASVTYAEAYLPPPGAPWHRLTAGPRLPYVPRLVSRADLSWRPAFDAAGEHWQGNLALGVTHVAPRPLPNERFSPVLFTVDAAARLRWRALEVGLEVTNVLDRRNRPVALNYVSNFRAPDAPASLLPEQHFAAGPPRAFFGTLTLYFEAPAEAGTADDGAKTTR